ncbi:hypothetical protein C8J57DRAFT_1260554 [Mycena rebaudengoi]|nr:hypothetical protein C8J57DRAFT_1260554 [Mycena rebaudengoi]
MNECPDFQAMLRAGTLAYVGDSSRLHLEDGTWVRRNEGECIIDAANRLLGTKVKFGTHNDKQESLCTSQVLNMSLEHTEFINSHSASVEELPVKEIDRKDGRDLEAVWVEHRTHNSDDMGHL